MRVTRLEIFGFKSFVERFSLSFDESIIGIVGPNGCGKSNIVDALRWVLGETQARHLRGKSLEDLIFNGSESRRPLGMAEVSLTIRPSDGWTDQLQPVEQVEPVAGNVEPVAGNEVQAVEDERVAASGEEKKEFDLEQIGAEVDLADAEPQDDSEQNAASTGIIPASLMQIPGLFQASEIQLTRRLYRSGESEYFVNRVPCRLRDMIDIYRLIGLGARGLSIVQQGQIGELISKKPIERRELLEEAAGISGFRARMEAAQRKLKKTSENMSRLADIILEVEKQVRSLKRQANRARARDEVKSLLKEAEIELFQCRSALIVHEQKEILELSAQVEQDLAERRSRMSVADSEQVELQAQLETVDTELMSLRGQREELYQTLNRERRRVEESQVQLARIEGKERALDDSKEQIELRRQAISTEQGELDSELEAQNVVLAETESKQQDAEASLRETEERNKQELEAFVPENVSSANNERSQQMTLLEQRLLELPELQGLIKDSERTLSGARAAVNTAKDKLHEAQKELSNTERERSTIAAQLARMAEHVGSDSAEAGTEALVSGLTVPENLERALSAALGDKAQYVISADPAGLAREYVRSLDSSAGKKPAKRRVGVISKRAAGSAISGSEGLRPLASHELAAVPEAKLLLELLDVDEAVRPSLELMLGDLALAPSLEQALALNAANAERGIPERMLVTPQGEVVTPWGWYTTQGESVGLSFRRRMEELDVLVSELQTKAAERLTEVEAAEARLTTAKFDLHEGLKSRDALLEVQQRLSRLLQQEKAEEKQLRDQAIQEERRRQDVARGKERAAESVLRAAMNETSNAKNALRFVERKVEGLASELESLERREQELETTRQSLLSEKTKVSEALALQSSDEAKRSAEEVQTRYEQVVEEITSVEERRDAVNLKFAEASQRVSEARRGLDGLNEKESGYKLQAEKFSLELQMLHEEVVKQYGEECEPVSEQKAEEISALYAAADSGPLKKNVSQRVGALREDAAKLRRRLEREGEVDPDAITRYEEEQARLDEMQAQQADLTQAVTTLERTIRQLKDVSRSRFLETFKDVNRRFTELVPRLFGGGAGHLELLNPEDPLTSGVEITVRPPGKRITTMELMSGGEKALVATAVLMAMFLHKPSPICVLDEVDAPLDDANLERFLELITEHSDKTQYLIITHNKNTMRAVDRLLGITMQESGVSTALSVNFAEAEEDIERWAANA